MVLIIRKYDHINLPSHKIAMWSFFRQYAELLSCSFSGLYDHRKSCNWRDNNPMRITNIRLHRRKRRHRTRCHDNGGQCAASLWTTLNTSTAGLVPVRRLHWCGAPLCGKRVLACISNAWFLEPHARVRDGSSISSTVLQGSRSWPTARQTETTPLGLASG